MKKIVSMFLAVLLLASLVACGGETEERKDFKKPSSQTGEESTDQTEKEERSLDIIQGSAFNEGMAMVTLRDQDGLFCIDEDGNILFSLTQEQYYPQSAFHDGIAMVFRVITEGIPRLVCKKDGTLVSAEDLGATEFYDPAENGWDTMLADGFIMVKNEDNKTFGVLDTKLEWRVPLSAELYAIMDEYRYFDYYNGYLLLKESSLPKAYIDLRTGEFGEDLSEVALKHPSDFLYVDRDGEVNNAVTGKTVFVVEGAGHMVNGDRKTYFRNGKMLVKDIVVANSGDHYYNMRYYVIDDSGNFILQPVTKKSKIDGAADDTVFFADEKLILAQYEVQNVEINGVTSVSTANTGWTICDLNGNVLGTYQLKMPETEENVSVYILLTEFEIMDDIVRVTYTYTFYQQGKEYATDEKHTEYFTLDFTPLF